MKRKELDRIDRRILKILQKEGRISFTELGERVGLSTTPCTERVRRMERDGVITAPRRVGRRRWGRLWCSEITAYKSGDIFEEFRRARRPTCSRPPCRATSTPDLARISRWPLPQAARRHPATLRARVRAIVMEEVKETLELPGTGARPLGPTGRSAPVRSLCAVVPRAGQSLSRRWSGTGVCRRANGPVRPLAQSVAGGRRPTAAPGGRPRQMSPVCLQEPPDFAAGPPPGFSPAPVTCLRPAAPRPSPSGRASGGPARMGQAAGCVRTKSRRRRRRRLAAQIRPRAYPYPAPAHACRTSCQKQGRMPWSVSRQPPPEGPARSGVPPPP